MDINKLYSIIETGTKEELTSFCANNNLSIKDGKIVHNSREIIDEQIKYWDKRQLVKKINLNS